MIVLDNFLHDPDAVRASAIASGFGRWHPKKGQMGANYYDGLNFYGDHAVIIETIYKKVGMIGFPNSTVFRVTNETTEKAVVHSDVGAGDTTCIIYLSQHSDRYGTGFYRNRRTNSSTMPPFAELVKDKDEFAKINQEIASSTEAEWEELEFIPGRYNRALLFTSNHYHRRFPDHGFGNDEYSGRMIWIGHFKNGVIA